MATTSENLHFIVLIFFASITISDLSTRRLDAIFVPRLCVQADGQVGLEVPPVANMSGLVDLGNDADA